MGVLLKEITLLYNGKMVSPSYSYAFKTQVGECGIVV
jgi:hypothetical protein